MKTSFLDFFLCSYCGAFFGLANAGHGELLRFFDDLFKPAHINNLQTYAAISHAGNASSFLVAPRGSAPLFGLYGDVPLDRVWFFGLAVLNRVYNLTCLCPKEGKAETDIIVRYPK